MRPMSAGLSKYTHLLGALYRAPLQYNYAGIEQNRIKSNRIYSVHLFVCKISQKLVP